MAGVRLLRIVPGPPAASPASAMTARGFARFSRNFRTPPGSAGVPPASREARRCAAASRKSRNCASAIPDPGGAPARPVLPEPPLGAPASRRPRAKRDIAPPHPANPGIAHPRSRIRAARRPARFSRTPPWERRRPAGLARSATLRRRVPQIPELRIRDPGSGRRAGPPGSPGTPGTLLGAPASRRPRAKRDIAPPHPANPGIAHPRSRIRAARRPARFSRNSRNPPGSAGVPPASREARHCAAASRKSRNCASAIPDPGGAPARPVLPELPEPSWERRRPAGLARSATLRRRIPQIPELRIRDPGSGRRAGPPGSPGTPGTLLGAPASRRPRAKRDIAPPRPANPGIAHPRSRIRAARRIARFSRNSRNPPGSAGVPPASREARHCAAASRKSRNCASAIPDPGGAPDRPVLPELPERPAPGRPARSAA